MLAITVTILNAIFCVIIWHPLESIGELKIWIDKFLDLFYVGVEVSRQYQMTALLKPALFDELLEVFKLIFPDQDIFLSLAAIQVHVDVMHDLPGLPVLMCGYHPKLCLFVSLFDDEPFDILDKREGWIVVKDCNFEALAACGKVGDLGSESALDFSIQLLYCLRNKFQVLLTSDLLQVYDI